jgi:hypothetical protein
MSFLEDQKHWQDRLAGLDCIEDLTRVLGSPDRVVVPGQAPPEVLERMERKGKRPMKYKEALYYESLSKSLIIIVYHRSDCSVSIGYYEKIS